jgi:stearoyl-CoA desaturase (delta-9 desaturase)
MAGRLTKNTAMTHLEPKSNQQEGKRNWPVTLTLGLTFIFAVTLVPWYGITVGFSGWAWAFFGLFMILTGVGIGSGYHRLWSHRAYEASPALQWFLAIVGGMSLQNSILIWSARHRVHHRYVDDNDKDPYSIGRGFWFAHVGWMLKDYESGEVDYSVVPDLEKNPIVMWQHKHYLELVLATNILLPLGLGFLVGDPLGVFLLAGLARLVLNHHFTFFINSLAHMWGKQPYTDENTAKDNWFLSIFTYGEGYHNFHHIFQSDYRNGIRWFAIDLNKWFIATASSLGLARGLRRTPQFKILRARLHMDFKRARERLAQDPANPRLRGLLETLETEYAQYLSTIKEWQSLQMEKVQAGKQRLADGKQKLADKFDASYRELELSLKMQRKRVALLTAQVHI